MYNEMRAETANRKRFDWHPTSEELMRDVTEVELEHGVTVGHPKCRRRHLRVTPRLPEANSPKTLMTMPQVTLHSP